LQEQEKMITAEQVTQSDLGELIGRVQAMLDRPAKWTTQIRDLGEQGYTLLEPIQVVIEEYRDESVIARFPEVEAFGEGRSEPEAIANLKLAILDLYDELAEAEPASLGKVPQAWQRVLKRLVSRL
jgi:hypothetical protein